MSTEHNFIFGNKITQTGPQSALDAQICGEENYFSQNALLNNADEIGSASAVFFNSPAMRTASVPVVTPEQLTALNGTFFQYQILATQFPYLFTRVGGSIPTGLSLNTASGALSGTPFIAGTYNISVTATNLQGVSSPKIIQVLVQTQPSTPKPILDVTASASGKVGTAFAYSIAATNAPTYFLVTSLPAGLTANTTTGLISGSPLLDGTFAAKIYAANAGGTSNQTLSILIAPTIPQITSATSAKAQVGESFTYRITAANLPKTYGAASLPAGLTVNATTGLITGVPTIAGNASANLSASNAAGTGTGPLTFSIVPPVPVITSATTSNATFGTAFSHQIIATHSPTLYAASSLPTGLTVNATSGLISGAPLADGTFTAKIYASNPGGIGNRTLTIAIAAKVPQITSATLAKPQAGIPFSYRISALNLPRTFGATSLPAGLTLNGTSGVISGTPTTSGNRTATISASNTAGTDTKTLTFSILPAVPVITSAGTSNATFGTAYSHQITATNTPKCRHRHCPSGNAFQLPYHRSKPSENLRGGEPSRRPHSQCHERLHHRHSYHRRQYHSEYNSIKHGRHRHQIRSPRRRASSARHLKCKHLERYSWCFIQPPNHRHQQPDTLRDHQPAVRPHHQRHHWPHQRQADTRRQPLPHDFRQQCRRNRCAKPHAAYCRAIVGAPPPENASLLSNSRRLPTFFRNLRNLLAH